MKNKKKQFQQRQHAARRKPDAVNPFEFRAVANSRSNAIDSKKPENPRHAPGISRKRAIEKRRETLLPELKLRRKANIFVDRRIGERDKGLSHEDRMIARFSREHARKYRKESIFNLGESEELTHRGKAIDDSADLRDDPRSDDDDDDAGDLLGEARFGGFLKKREEAPGSQSWKERLEEMIATTREKRAHMQKQKDEALDLTEKLDSQWKDLSGVLQASGKKDPKEKEPVKPDDYELLVREFKLSSRAAATDSLKRTEKNEEFQKEYLEKMEEEKRKRMAPPQKMTAFEKKMKRSLASADALPEDFLPGEALDEPNEPVRPNRHSRKVVEETISRVTATAPELPRKVLEKVEAIEAVQDNEEAVVSLLKRQQCAEHEAAVAEALVTKFHPGLGSDNKTQLMGLWTLLLQYLDDCARDPVARNLRNVECLMPLMCKLALNFPQYAGQCLQDVLIQKHQNVVEFQDYPGLDTFVFMQLVGALFPVTDFRHSVATPVVVLLSHAFSVGRLDRPRAVFAAVYSLGLTLKFTREAERYCPEGMTVLLNLLNSALPQERLLTNLFPFEYRPVGRRALLAVTQDEVGSDAVKPEPLCPSSAEREVKCLSPCDKISILFALLDLLEGYAAALSRMPSVPEVFSPFLSVLDRLGEASTNVEVRSKIASVSEDIRETVARCRKPSSLLEAAKPKMLRLYEPRIDAEYMQGRKRLVAKRKRKTESQILQQRVREETRGAMKELRKDSAFVAAEMYKEQRRKDAEEKEKLKKLMASLQGQESEFKTLQKQKSKFKRK